MSKKNKRRFEQPEPEVVVEEPKKVTELFDEIRKDLEAKKDISIVELAPKEEVKECLVREKNEFITILTEIKEKYKFETVTFTVSNDIANRIIYSFKYAKKGFKYLKFDLTLDGSKGYNMKLLRETLEDNARKFAD